MVRVDPDLRCAAMLVYGCQLVVLPLKKDFSSDDPTARCGVFPAVPLVHAHIFHEYWLSSGILTKTFVWKMCELESSRNAYVWDSLASSRV